MKTETEIRERIKELDGLIVQLEIKLKQKQYSYKHMQGKKDYWFKQLHGRYTERNALRWVLNESK